MRHEATSMVGRVVELAALDDALAVARDGRPHLVLVTGEAGIGKTRLVGELADIAPTGMPVRIGESVPQVGPTLAYGPFAAALPGWTEWLDPDGVTGGGAAARHRHFERLLGVLTKHAPLVLVLEDLHWADASSLDLLAFLAVRVSEEPILVVATLRDDELDDAGLRWLVELERRPRVTRLHLGPLTDGDVAGLVGSRLPPGADPGRVEDVVALAGGNPFFAEELAAAVPDWPPRSLTAAITTRLAGVPATTRRVLDQLSVSGADVHHDTLARAVRLPERTLLTAVRQAVGLRLLSTDGDAYAFPHALTREVVHGQLLPGDRRRLHRRLAEALALGAPGVEPASLAYHWRLGGCPDRAARAALAGARRCGAARAYPEADRLYAAALELSDSLPDGERTEDVLVEAARAASLAGDPERAAAYVETTLARATGSLAADRAALLERLGRYRWEAGHLRESMEATRTAAGLLAGRARTALTARVLASLATGHLLLGELDQALSLAERAVAIAVEVDAGTERAHGLATLGVLRARLGELESGLAALRESIEVARLASAVEDVLRAAANQMYLLCTAGRFAEALDAAGRGRELARSMGAPPGATAVLDNNTAAVLVATGRWAEAKSLLAELLPAAGGQIAPYLRLLALELAVGGGDRERAADLRRRLADESDDPRLSGPLHACLAEQACDDGDPEAASRAVVTGLAAVAGRGLPEEELRLLAVGCRTAADLARGPGHNRPPGPDWHRIWPDFAERARALAEPAGTAELAAFATLVDAEDRRRRGADSRPVWRAVADAWHRADQPHREAYARLREAEAAVRAGRREQAARALAACVSIAHRLPAPPLLTAAEALTRRARLAPIPDGTAADRARTDLTDRETQVLRLLIDGDSNRQIARQLFISERTVAVHVSHIFDKLGVRNRTQAATIGARLLPDAPTHPPTSGKAADVRRTPARR